MDTKTCDGFFMIEKEIKKEKEKMKF